MSPSTRRFVKALRTFIWEIKATGKGSLAVAAKLQSMRRLGREYCRQEIMRSCG